LKQESVLHGKSFATLEIREPKEADLKAVDSATKPADSIVKPSDGAVSKIEKKESLLPSFVEFDLRSAGLEKSAQETAQTGAASNLLSGAKAP
jgi:hypothetical protein